MKIFFVVASVLGAGAPDPTAAWPQDLHASGGGLWRQRIPIEIRNETDREARGEPAGIPLGNGEGALALEGALPIEGVRAEEIRLCDPNGQELLFRIEDPAGRLVARGPIPAGCSFVFPIECPAKGRAACYLYYSNPSAWPVPDHLEARLGVRNGGVEEGSGDAPFEWRHDPDRLFAARDAVAEAIEEPSAYFSRSFWLRPAVRA